MKRATGSFEVTLQPLANAEVSGDPLLGRFLLTKKFSGDLDAQARGHMLSAGTATQGSAGYVAIDQVTGTLEGRTGGFMLQHSGSMNRGVPIALDHGGARFGHGRTRGPHRHAQHQHRRRQTFLRIHLFVLLRA